ncbi:AcrR family transcriptional regulator [Caulobacter ginsengisoli]|uniref:AcrR family transcriptional regulator n=1 Tax=Caulobacter ginsengisoli TaxID=400775 RepID=A0ABU0INX6_9CAUL|nr:helix-turn-helix domain-containing protein [Caulobacter ginsengisoli]MDQ0463685.1 AcrR family transcriptional regulator [Caulobacter ginsengisoli]
MTLVETKRRISAEARRDGLLEAAARLIVEQGLVACTLEAVGEAAGVSKALVYKHFANRPALFEALIEREFAEIRRRGLSLAPVGTPLAQAREPYLRSYLRYLAERGAVLRSLLGDPTIASLTARQRRGERGGIEGYFVKGVMEAYGLPKDLAMLGLRMTLYAPESAIGWMTRTGFDLDRAAEFWATFLEGGWRAAAGKFGTD